jgi:hypothetical protein
VSHKLATIEGESGPLSFKLFNVGDQLLYQYRLATVEEVEANREALLEAMPTWEIANLADGSVEGASYGGRTRYLNIILDLCFYFGLLFSVYPLNFALVLNLTCLGFVVRMQHAATRRCVSQAGCRHVNVWSPDSVKCHTAILSRLGLRSFAVFQLSEQFSSIWPHCLAMCIQSALDKC